MRLFGLISILILTIVIFLSSNEKQESCGFIQNGYGERVSIPIGKSIKFILHKDTSPFEEKETLAAAQEWNNIFEKDVIIIDTSKKSTNEFDKDSLTNVIFFASKWNNKEKEQAKTFLRWVGTEITAASIAVNRKNFRFEGEVDNRKQVDLKSLMIHEFGHALGLKHNDEESSTMNSDLPSYKVRNILQSDIRNVSCQFKIKKESLVLIQNDQ